MHNHEQPGQMKLLLRVTACLCSTHNLVELTPHKCVVGNVTPTLSRQDTTQTLNGTTAQHSMHALPLRCSEQHSQHAAQNLKTTTDRHASNLTGD
jgi:hypothetical protein